MSSYLWLIPILPGIAALINGLWGRTLKEKTGYIAAGALGISCLLTLIAFVTALAQGHDFHPRDIDYYTWLASGDLIVPFGVYIDQLTLVMMFVVTFVGSIIFVYAIGYMHGDPSFARFFTYMPLFAFFMLLLVMGNSLPMLFVGWEGVGLCSYLLIGYYYDRDYAADAGKKAFIVNRIGDFGFLLGMLLIFWYTGSMKFTGIFEAAPHVFLAAGLPITLITLLLFVGATGKSAQIPLYVWLPDAMAGPTPVSALIHAATMVTAGVYMVARMNILYSLAPATLLIIGVIGGLTAIIAASIALVQREAKKILAYSTVSQLGYMFLACGSGAYIAAVFHLMTHAFFKACLFLGSGSVLHAFHSNTDVDVFEAGGLRKYMPYTRWTFLIATLAIAGIPPLAGFFSKDEILWEAVASGREFLWVLGIITAFMTSFYMFRLYNLLFSGEFRGTQEQEHHLHESPAIMWIPLVILAAFSIGVGWLNMPLFGLTWFHDFLAPVTGVFYTHEETELHEVTHTWEWVFAIISVIVALLGIFLARLFYVWAPTVSSRMRETFAAPYDILFRKYGVDEVYQENIVDNYYRSSRGAYWFDEKVIVAGLNKLAQSAVWSADKIRKIQTGTVPHYALATIGGMVFLVVWLLLCY